GVADPAEVARQANLIVFCVPVDVLAREVLAVAGLCRRGTLLTDVGSTKVGIVSELEDKLPSGVAFVGSHPLAGSEKIGSEYARADLFTDRLVTVTAEEENEPAQHITEFWRALGARVERLTAVEHDRALAWTSHLPHLAASALAGILPGEWQHFPAAALLRSPAHR